MTTIDTIDHDDWLRDIRARLASTCDTYTAELLSLNAIVPDASEASAHAALLTGVRQNLADTTEALRRIDNGEYGRCMSCLAAIPPERLEAVPQARTCVGCTRRQ